MKSENKIKTIVFFFVNPIRASRRESFQFERLESLGYDIYILDATKYFNFNLNMTSSVIHKNTVECHSIEDFLKFRKSFSSRPVLFVTSDQYNEIASPVFNLIIKKRDKLLTFKTKSFSDKDFTSNKFRLGVDKTIKALDKFLPLHFLKFYYKWKYKIFIPDYFLCSTEYLIPTKIYLTIKKSNRINVHADDINETLTNKPSVIDPKRKVGVFLDQHVPFMTITHPLIYPPGTFPENYVEIYYKEVERTLYEIKKKLGLDEIVISLHPSSIHFQEELIDKLLDFSKFVWKTPEMIRDSYLIITHCTTALSYAVYYNKPVILLESEVLNNNRIFYKSFKFFKEKLNLPSIKMDGELSENIELEIDEKRYNEYLTKFLKNNQIKENSYYYAIAKIMNETN